MKKWISALLALVFLAISCAGAFAATPEEYDPSNPQNLEAGHLYCEAAILIDADTGDVLFAHNPGIRMNPASTTKMMTLLVALESGISLDAIVTIPQEVNDTPKDSSLVPVHAGEQMSFRDLLYAFMLTSGNDGSIAISIIVSGTEAAFVEKMNARAAEIGCIGTHFSNSHGYTDEYHYSTAQDLALIAQECMRNETFRHIVSLEEYTMTTSVRGEVTVYTSGDMLRPSSEFYWEPMIGIKTGSTSAAGQCYVGAAEIDGKTLISVILHSQDKTTRWTDTRKVLEYGYTQYSEYTFARMYNLAAGQLVALRVTNAAEDDAGEGMLPVALANVSDNVYSWLVYDKSEERLGQAVKDFASRVEISVTHDLVAPVYEGEVIGNISYTAPDGEVITGLLVATRTIEARPEKITIQDILPFLKYWDNMTVRLCVIAVGLILLLIVIGGIRRRIRRNRRRRQIYERRMRAMREREARARQAARQASQSRGYSDRRPPARTSSRTQPRNYSDRRR